MRLWFDLSNSPHINLFHQLIIDFEQSGHDVIITSRPLANTIELLDQKGLKHTIIGTHYGKKILYKIIGFPIRVYQLYTFLKFKDIDLAISQSSFHSPIVAKLLKIPSIYTNDNEHALGNILAFYFATKILLPEHIQLSNLQLQFLNINKIVKYPGVKEGIFLWIKAQDIIDQRKNKFNNKTIIYIRPEPQTAQYYKGNKNFLDAVIIDLQGKYDIIILPRNKDQQIYYNQTKFNKIQVATHSLSFNEIALNCTLFIGAGGSMTREFAILGIPTISVYDDKLLGVDKYLVDNDFMIHTNNISTNDIESIINNQFNHPDNLLLLKKGEFAYQLFKDEILQFDNLSNVTLTVN